MSKDTCIKANTYCPVHKGIVGADCRRASPASAPEALDWLETELSAISCRYHGDPSYDHDAYWMRGRVEKLLEEARKLFTAPAPPVSEDRKDMPPVQSIPKERLALNVRHQDCHKAADAFWRYWNEYGETHKHGYYESTWGAINQALRTVGVVEHEYRKADAAMEDKP